MRQYIKRLVLWLLYGVPVNKTYAKITVVQYDERLKGKKVLITGGGRGLGFYMAQKLVNSDAQVVIVGRSEETLKDASKKLKNCPYIPFDVRNYDKYFELIDKANQLVGGGLNCLINNAGISLHEHSFEDVTHESYNAQFDTNLKSPFFLTQSFIKYSQSHNTQNLNIIFVTSERGMYCDTLPYGLTKAAINSLTKGLARIYATKDIRVNAIAPGVTASDLVKIDTTGDIYREKSCGKRFYLPEEVAEAIAFLISDESSCISGEILPCNQGNHYRSDY